MIFLRSLHVMRQFIFFVLVMSNLIAFKITPYEDFINFISIIFIIYYLIVFFALAIIYDPFKLKF